MGCPGDLFGDSSLRTPSLARLCLRLAAFVVVFLAGLLAHGDFTSEQIDPDNFSARGIAQWLQPSAAEAAPRQRRRSRKARAANHTSQAAAETSEQPARLLAPLTPFVQIWPHADPVVGAKQSAPAQDAAAIEPTGIVSPMQSEHGGEINATDIVQADELSELDRAAASSTPRPPVTKSDRLRATDGSASAESADHHQTASAPAFYESVTAIIHAPWLNSVLFVMAGSLGAFIAARIFMRA